MRWLRPLVLVLAVAGWALISVRHEARVHEELESQKRELVAMIESQRAGLEALEGALEERRGIHAEMDQRERELESAFCESAGWAGLAVPDAILDRLCGRAAQDSVPAAGVPLERD